jgi:hypothetical protein
MLNPDKLGFLLWTFRAAPVPAHRPSPISSPFHASILMTTMCRSCAVQVKLPGLATLYPSTAKGQSPIASFDPSFLAGCGQAISRTPHPRPPPLPVHILSFADVTARVRLPRDLVATVWTSTVTSLVERVSSCPLLPFSAPVFFLSASRRSLPCSSLF